MISSGRGAFGALAVEIGDQAVLGAFDDVVGQALVERQVGARFLLSRFTALRKCSVMAAMWNWLMAAFCSAVCCAPVLGRGSAAGPDRDVRTRRRSVEEQVLRQAALLFGNGGEALQLFGVDDGQIEPGLGAVIEEDGVHHFARRGGQAERDVGDAQHRLDVRDAFP